MNALKLAAPSVAKAMMPQASPFMPDKPKPDALSQAGNALVKGFQRGFDPQGYAASQAQSKTDEQERAKQTLALMQQQRQLPEPQRAVWWTQNADQIGQIVGADVRSMEVQPGLFTDQALDGQIAMLSAKLGQAPEQPEYMNLGNGTVGQVRGGAFSIAHQGPTDPVKPTVVNNRVLDPNDPTKVLADYSDQKPDQPEYAYENFDGAVWAVDKSDPTKRTRLGSAPQGTQANPPETYRSLTPDEVAARGYSPGTVVQVDSRGREFVNARPSTAQTGQPTEGERNAGMHVGVSLNGLQNITNMEGRGYNRAGVGEQFSTLFGENEKLYDQAAAEFIDGYLRAMTGAAATATEIDTYRKQWFPQFGDNDKVVKQKAAGRLNAIQAMKSKAGRSWNPAWDSIIDQLATQVGGAANNIAPPPATPASAADLGDDELRAMLGLD